MLTEMSLAELKDRARMRSVGQVEEKKRRMMRRRRTKEPGGTFPYGRQPSWTAILSKDTEDRR